MKCPRDLCARSRLRSPELKNSASCGWGLAAVGVRGILRLLGMAGYWQEEVELAPATFFFFKTFLMWTIFKVFIEFVTALFLFYVLVFWS